MHKLLQMGSLTSHKTKDVRNPSVSLSFVMTKKKNFLQVSETHDLTF